MKTRALTLALFLFAAAAATAQVPRTINYQGLIKTSTGLLNGTERMTLRIYNTETGGTPLWSETHDPVTFKNGIFTVGIGANSFGGISEAVDFDQQLWLGVTVTNVNGGNELEPRFILRSSPYSFRSITSDSAAKSALAVNAETAALAEQAKKADSASYLIAPSSMTLTGTGTTLQVTSTQGKGLEVKGSPYAIVSTGIDSTTEHYVARDTAGPLNPPAIGGFYRDNAPIAWGTIYTDGRVVADFGIESVVLQPDNTYLVTLSNPVRTVTFLDQQVPDMAPVISLAGISKDGEPETLPAYTTWSYRRNGTDYDPKSFFVKVYTIASGQGSIARRPFSIVVFGRP